MNSRVEDDSSISVLILELTVYHSAISIWLISSQMILFHAASKSTNEYKNDMIAYVKSKTYRSGTVLEELFANFQPIFVTKLKISNFTGGKKCCPIPVSCSYTFSSEAKS